MFENIENIKLLYISQGINKSRTIMRKNHGLIYRLSGIGIYHFENRSVETKKGDIIFVPKDAEYFFEVPLESDCRYISITFEGEIKNPRFSVFSSQNFPGRNDFAHHLVNWWKSGDAAEIYSCHAFLYNLLAFLAKAEDTDYALMHKFSIIKPAETYLKKHIYDCNLNVDNLHKFCSISDTYFRRIFQKKYGMPPRKYIINRRLSHAKLLLENKDYDSIGHLAQSVGYADPLYFSRAFKEKYGVAPTEINTTK